jgi:arylsulfatase A-like enzyme
MAPERIKLFSCFPESEEVRSDVADYYWEVQRFDREVGELLAILENSGELENTLVVMTGDHGMPFPRCKGNLYDTGTHVPLAMRWPPMIKAGRIVEDFVSLTDLAPTYLDLADAEVPNTMTGQSLVKILLSPKSGQVDPARDCILFGKERHVPGQEDRDSGGTPMRAIRTHDFLYIQNFLPHRWPAGTPDYENAFFPGSWYGDVDNGPTKSYMIKNRDKDELHRRLFDLSFSKRPAEELYALRTDPGQLNNVAEENSYTTVKQDLSKRLRQHLKESGDPRILMEDPPFDYYPYYGGSPLKPGFSPDEQ